MSRQMGRWPCEHMYPHVAHKHRGPGWREVRCPGVKPPAGARIYPPAVRREVLSDLRSAARYLHIVVGEWAVDSQMWEQGVGFTRPRRIEEYPENSRKAWSELARDLDTLIGALSTLREEANSAVEAIEQRDARPL